MPKGQSPILLCLLGAWTLVVYAAQTVRRGCFIRAVVVLYSVHRSQRVSVFDINWICDEANGGAPVSPFPVSPFIVSPFPVSPYCHIHTTHQTHNSFPHVYRNLFKFIIFMNNYKRIKAKAICVCISVPLPQQRMRPQNLKVLTVLLQMN